MKQVFAHLSANAADLAFSVAFFLICYLIARLLKVAPPVALGFAVLPMLVLYWLQNPGVPARLMAALS
ncbi:hypothetical protein [Devosia salina]|uniref:AI-2E family transporter n=1 Tax=Devosia salina TaxID=2860336 RepID=A0ABX8WHC0_9HYPH|nr:hypothetical protein [Devosia salina]QYO77094.1 hypothetical protein K1X15_00335 [Devosia salina]